MVLKKTVVYNFINNVFIPMEMAPRNQKALYLYLYNFSSVELTSALHKYNSLDFDKRHLFLNALHYNSLHYNDKSKNSFSLHTLDKELWRIKRGALNTNYIFKTGQDVCGETIIGFIRAFEKGTVFTTKVTIDGEMHRVFIKNRVGNMISDGGYNHIILDPKSMFLYNLPGYPTLTLNDISKLKLSSKNKIISEYWDNSLKSKYKILFDNALNNYISKHKNKNTNSIKKDSIVNLFSKIKKKLIK